MDRPHRRLVASPVVIALSLALAGCGSGATSGPSSSSGPPPIPPSPTPAASSFNLTVAPTAFTGLIQQGAAVVLLVSVDGSPSDGPVAVTATVPGGTASVEPAQLVPGKVAEVTVTDLRCPSACDQVKAQVNITATRGATTRSESREMTLTPEANQLEAEARLHLSPFIAWLAANRPELKITPQTTWAGVPAPWVLIVEHHLFFSTDWELDLSWHVMIAPDDWSRIALRHRSTELTPSLAFQIDSVSGATTPHEIQPPDAVWR